MSPASCCFVPCDCPMTWKTTRHDLLFLGRCHDRSREHRQFHHQGLFDALPIGKAHGARHIRARALCQLGGDRNRLLDTKMEMLWSAYSDQSRNRQDEEPR